MSGELTPGECAVLNLRTVIEHESDLKPLAIVNGWLAEDTGECQCGGGGSDMMYQHMPRCYLEPIVNLNDLLAEVDRLRNAALTVMAQVRYWETLADGDVAQRVRAALDAP